MSVEADRLALEALRLLVRQVVRDELRGASPATPATEGFIGTAEAARRAGVGADAVLTWIAKGLLAATKPPGTKSWRIRAEDLDALLAGRTGAKPVSLEAKRAERREARRVSRAGRRGEGAPVKAPRQEARGCTVCGEPVRRRRKNGQLARTCDAVCQLEALDKMIAALEHRREVLLEELERGRHA
jgi:excisionase family DNA binding protein